MIAVLVIPTGVGATIGGDAGDGNPVAKLLAGCCDTLITHPNVVNASDINEMTDNTLYVDGAMLDRFLNEQIDLQRVITYNKILVVTNEITAETINAVSAARATIGIDAEIFKLPTPLLMRASTKDNRAGGYHSGIKELVSSIKNMKFDALAIHTPIRVDREVALNYYKYGGINPWGGIEAIVSRGISFHINKPVAHAPIEGVPSEDTELFFIFKKIVPSRIAAEAISICYLHCVLKGLHRAPRAGRGINVTDVNVLISPYKCWGAPHRACRLHGIPIIAVKENKITCPTECQPDIIVKNYLEAAGVLQAMKAGVCLDSVRAKFEKTFIIGDTK